MTATGIVVAMLCGLPLVATSFAVAQIDGTSAPAPPARRPNILFLMADDWSAPYAGALGDPVVQTPAFDRVAREGVLFSNAFVSAPSCTPSRLAVATGQWHWRLADGANLGGSLRADVPVYPELLRAAGYQIGFARKGAQPSDHKYTHRDPFGPRFQTFEEFIARRTAGAPFCFWYGAGEPHRPYRFGEGATAGLDPAKVKLPGCLPDNETTRRDFADYLHRIQRYDSDCARMLGLLETSGELDNTIVVMSGDNGMPFPRCKATLYDTGTHVPLAIRWGGTIPGGRTVTDFVSLTDLAPTFLEAAGLQPAPEMTGRSLMRILRSGRSGPVDRARTAVLSGMERHVVSQPARAIRTTEFLYIRNFALESWPRIETTEPLPRIDYAKGAWVADGTGFPLNLEQSPTLQFLFDHRDQPELKPFYTRATGPRPEEELYDLDADPAQLHNVAGDPSYARNRAALRRRLTNALRAAGDPRLTVAARAIDTRTLAGWTVRISRELLAKDAAATARALELLRIQLEEITHAVPAAAVTELQAVPLWISPEYPDTPPRAEYHPRARWLREHGRDPAMAKGVEFTNVRIFDAETRRMPNFTLHELAHAYHHRVLEGGFANKEIGAAYEKAKASGRYDRVERQDAEGRKRMDRAYALTDPQEYFAETTEAFFSRNDFFPYTRDELKQHDPEMFALLTKLWGVEAKPGTPERKTAAALEQAPVDFQHPPRDYVQHRLAGWDVLVEKELVDRAPELANRALARLDKKLGETVAVLPPAALPDLRRVNLFLMYGPDAKAGGRAAGLEYFRADAASDQDWLDPRMARSIVIWSAPNYAKLSESWALKALVHEFGHAQHLEHWPESHPEIYDTWDRALKAGLYQVVREEDKGTHEPNYAARNHLEYFAELTAMYFVGAHYFPRDRAGLRAYDPAGYALLEKLWGLNGAPAAAAPERK